MHSTTHRFTLQSSSAHSLITRTNKPTLMVLTLQTVPYRTFFSHSIETASHCHCYFVEHKMYCLTIKLTSNEPTFDISIKLLLFIPNS